MVHHLPRTVLVSLAGYSLSRSGHSLIKGSAVQAYGSSRARSSGAFRARTSVSSLLDRRGPSHSWPDQCSYPLAHCRSYSSNEDGGQQRQWRRLDYWPNASEEKFMSYSWQTAKSIRNERDLGNFLRKVLEGDLPSSSNDGKVITSEEFILDVLDGIRQAPMAICLTPYILSAIDWTDPVNDPIRRQFIPLKSTSKPDHPALTLDSLHEEDSSPVPGLVHRYPDKVLFLATSACPIYCRFCTRSYAVGNSTNSVEKSAQKPTKERWNRCFEYIESHTEIQDVVVSGGDCYLLEPWMLTLIGERLLSIPHVRRVRFASRGMAACPMRILDPNDGWAQALIDLSDLGRAQGKQVALHTHFNHPHEISAITERAAARLHRAGVILRNQTVLLRRVNDDVPTMARLIRRLADMNIQPYYVYQADMVPGVEDMRTPLSTILHLELHTRCIIAGFMTPSFVVDLPGGGGKRLALSFESYDEATGISTWRSPAIHPDRIYVYHDPKE